MLVLKKMTVKKIAVYCSIMFIMLGGTGFMMYQNYKLTNNQAGAIDNPAQYNALMQTGVAGPVDVAVLLADPQSVSAPSQLTDVNKFQNDGGFDSTIFSSEKFKALKENAIAIQENPEAGKRDPFQPN
ncbi:MAG: hypothetical protein Q7R92_03970 [bacterium]|nr:hypothetical protein [bacterium]